MRLFELPTRQLAHAIHRDSIHTEPRFGHGEIEMTTSDVSTLLVCAYNATILRVHIYSVYYTR